ncbi:MAG: hypothetical protein GJU72_14335 [Acidithiobacillus ferriphilus]|uniref:hypothetical protein n=1 Tax=Acidithiobacillus ferriphilus TaxID=1689834 RepID=UPI0024305503|nr:hypothetical protein [Acidithiobacillus ferriphilus]MBW9250201.1 hypothetical protein [Acidithiobacillus ferriphilus]MBW9254504.1 hypothetical protein [Acidithiobacillus ferriphilus]
MTTTYEQKRVLHDEAPLMLGAWQFAPEMKQVRGGDATVGTICGHHSPHAVRIFLDGAWTTFCMDCWRRNRRSYRRPNGLLPQTESSAEQVSAATIRKTFDNPFLQSLRSGGR